MTLESWILWNDPGGGNTVIKAFYYLQAWGLL